MKNLFLLASLLFVLAACNTQEKVKGANGETYGTAVQYNDYIVNRQVSLMKSVMQFAAVAQKDLDSAERLLDRFIIETSVMKKEIEGMPAWRGDSTLREAAIRTFGFYYRAFADDYKLILHLKMEQDGTNSEIENQINSIIQKITEEEKIVDARFQEAQKKFARDNKMKLQENEMQKEFERIKEGQ